MLRWLLIICTTFLFQFLIIPSSLGQSPNTWLGQTRSDVVGSDGRILNDTEQLLYPKMHVRYSDCGEDCGLDTWNSIYLEFVTAFELKTRDIKNNPKRTTYLLELFDEKRDLLASYFLSEYDVDVDYHEQARYPYIYKISVTEAPRIILKNVVSWNLVAIE